MSDLGVTLFWSSVQITVVTATAVIVCLLLRSGTPHVRGRVLQTTFVLTLALSALVFSPWPRWSNVTPAGEVDVHAVDISLGTYVGADIAPVAAPDVVETTESVVRSRAPYDWIASAWGTVRELDRASLLRVLPLVALAGMLIGLFRSVTGVVAVQQLVRTAKPVTDEAIQSLLEKLRGELLCRRPVDVRETDHLSTAATIGWRRPVILLPAAWRGWSSEERRAVLAHELAHIVRQDFASLVVAQISGVLHYYHPLMHWLVARLRLEQELVADAMAARAAGGRGTYLTVLATMALQQEDQPMGWPARSFLPTRGTFLRRIEMLRDSRQRTGRVGAGGAAAALAAIVVVGVLAAGLRSRNVNAQNQPPTLRGQRAEEIDADIATSQNNLKILGLAMHNYHDRHGHFPPAVVTHESGETHSWRVALLPFLDLQDLYSAYRQDEPWDSETNLKVLAQIPDVFRAPQADEDSSNASYFVFAGEGTAFSNEEGVRIRDFRDGTSNTILIVEVKKDVPWTKPEDVEFPPNPIDVGEPPFSSWYEDRLMACLADGSARAFPIRLDPDVSNALIQIADGERVDWDRISAPGR